MIVALFGVCWGFVLVALVAWAQRPEIWIRNATPAETPNVTVTAEG